MLGGADAFCRGCRSGSSAASMPSMASGGRAAARCADERRCRRPPSEKQAATAPADDDGEVTMKELMSTRDARFNQVLKGEREKIKHDEDRRQDLSSSQQQTQRSFRGDGHTRRPARGQLRVRRARQSDAGPASRPTFGGSAQNFADLGVRLRPRRRGHVLARMLKVLSRWSNGPSSWASSSRTPGGGGVGHWQKVARGGQVCGAGFGGGDVPLPNDQSEQPQVPPDATDALEILRSWRQPRKRRIRTGGGQQCPNP